MDLEKENTKIRRAMQAQAGSIGACPRSPSLLCRMIILYMRSSSSSIGQDGFKYAGMLPEQLVKVNDFAMNLKEGRVDLPLDDQSRALLKVGAVCSMFCARG